MTTPDNLHFKGRQIFFVLSTLLLFLVSTVQAENIFLDEQFTTLESWEPFYFKDIENHSSYSAESLDGTPCLIAASNNSASGILFKKHFNVYDFPNTAWRWKISNIYKKGDSTGKDGDDSPIRLYVMFQYDSEKASVFKKIQYETLKLLYEEYPPHSSLSYAWTNKKYSLPFIPNPYSDLAMIIPVDSGQENVGKWLEHTVNIVQDYQTAFDEDPPPLATIVIISDSDNTGESAKAYVDYIKIFRK